MEETDCFVATVARAAGPITTATFKLGGNPVFLSHLERPICKQCGQDMDFLAQIPLRSPLPFSTRYAIAYVFMCPGKFDTSGWLECETWRPFEGANAVSLQDDRGQRVVPQKFPRYPDYHTTLVKSSEPDIDMGDHTIADEIEELVSSQTKLGGVPYWLQSNETPNCPICGKSMQFVAQINAEADGPLPVDPSQ